MNPLVSFSIPIYGLKQGTHHFDFFCNSDFFMCFEESPISNGEFTINLEVQKLIDLIQFSFTGSGWISSQCDRCTADIRLPVETNWELILKYGMEEIEDDNVIYINSSMHHYDISRIVYESLVVSMPITKVYPCEKDIPKPCNQKVLDILYKHNTLDSQSGSSIWDALKNK